MVVLIESARLLVFVAGALHVSRFLAHCVDFAIIGVNFAPKNFFWIFLQITLNVPGLLVQ
jgi:hypothetical protein